MLVTLGTGQAISAGGSATFTYACRSLQKIFFKIDDDAEAQNITVTVQLGQRTICNGVPVLGLFGISSLQGGVPRSGTEHWGQIDFGSHQLLDNENLYVTMNSSSGITAVDVSALVDQPTGGEYPCRYTLYSDNVFTAENVLCAVSFNASAGVVDEDANNIEIRNAVTSSSPSLLSCNDWYGASAVQPGSAAYYGLLVKEEIPLTTTFNYTSSTTNRILVVSLMGTNNRAIGQGRRAQAIATSQVGN